MPPARIDPQRILLVLHGSIGDVTRALPLAGLLRAGYPQAFIAWSVEPAAAPLVEELRRFSQTNSPVQFRSGAGLAAPS